jgi:Fur family iron response transcriptional regulator
MMIVTQLQAAGLRATPKRIAIGGLLLDGVDRHVTADDVAVIARKAGVRVSLATVYNTLNQFVAAGLMKRITLDTDRTYFDTNVSDHHHLFFEENGVLHDIPGDNIRVEGLPPIPPGSKVRSVEVIVRMTGDRKAR